MNVPELIDALCAVIESSGASYGEAMHALSCVRGHYASRAERLINDTIIKTIAAVDPYKKKEQAHE